MTTHSLEFFRDENPGLFRSHPLEVIRATTIAHAGNPYVDSNDRVGAERVVFYNDTTGTAGHNETRLVLRMVQHAGGAWNKAAAQSTVNGATEGRILHADGSMAATGAATVDTLQGVLFANYYDLQQNRLQDSRVVTAQQNGDLYWVVVEGMIELHSGTDTIDVHVPVITANDAEGGMCEIPVAWAAGGAATNVYFTQLHMVGIALENGIHDAMTNCLIDIRALGYRPFA